MPSSSWRWRRLSLVQALLVALTLAAAPGWAEDGVSRPLPQGSLRPAGQAPGIRIQLEFGDGSLEVSPDASGKPLLGAALLSRARPFLEQIYQDQPYAGTPVWKALVAMSHPAFQAAASRVVAVAPRSSWFSELVLVIDDDSHFFSTGAVGPGYPDWMARGANAGDTSGPLGLAWGTGPLESIWPHAEAYPLAHPRQPRTHTHRVGGAVIGNAGFPRGPAAMSIEETLLHELAHTADASPRDSLGYGADGNHRGDDVLSPTGAFCEGWADYQSQFQPAGWEDRGPAASLQVPLLGRVAETEAAGVHVLVAPWDRSAGVLILANELGVAGVLTMLASLPPGRDAVDAAFVATQTVRSRTLADFLGAYLKAHPETRAMVRMVLQVCSAGVGDAAFYEALLAGRLPAGFAAETVSLAPSYRPSPRPRGWAPLWDRVLEAGDPRHPLFFELDPGRARRGKQAHDPTHTETYEAPRPPGVPLLLDAGPGGQPPSPVGMLGM